MRDGQAGSVMMVPASCGSTWDLLSILVVGTRGYDGNYHHDCAASAELHAIDTQYVTRFTEVK